LMAEISLDKVLLVVCVSLFTALAAVSDLRTRRIPNKLTIPVFLLGLIYQVAFHGWAGLADAGAGFAVGFGILFVLWLVGGGGGGDVKLMGALGVWLGFRMTLMVLILSTAFVVLGSVTIIAISLLRRGAALTKAKYASPQYATQRNRAEQGGHPDRDVRQRRIMAFALPVALATWLLMLSVVFTR
jgi:prepilin peptidase CpaA